MDKNTLKQKTIEAIEEQKSALIDIGNRLYSMPETGYKEKKTSLFMKGFFEDLGLSVKSDIAVTGLKTSVTGKKDDFNVGVCGELDALIIPGHPMADPETGVAHVCGHHCQLTMLAGVAMGLVKSGLIKELDGKLTFLVVPAEEIIELEFRAELMRQEKIKFLDGKQNFIHYGAIDDVDCILCSHLTSVPHKHFNFGKHYNGVITKDVRFIGKSAHSAMSPDLAINALHAAISAINNINALRERFRDDDHIRVHYIMTKGGLSVNIIPDDVRLEMGVRGSSPDAMAKANKMVNKAIIAGAEGIGAQAQIVDYGGLLPFNQNEDLNLLFAKNAAALVGEENVVDNRAMHRASSTDAGDFSTLRPTIHPNFGGASGKLHGLDFEIVDDYLAYVMPSKAYAMTVIDLLWNNAELGKEIKESFEPVFNNKEEYDKFGESLMSVE